jgi:hypothetical protein
VPPLEFEKVIEQKSRLQSEVLILRHEIRTVKEQLQKVGTERNDLSYKYDMLLQKYNSVAEELSRLKATDQNLRMQVEAFGKVDKVSMTVKHYHHAYFFDSDEENNNRPSCSLRNWDKFSDSQIQTMTSLPSKLWIECFGRILRSASENHALVRLKLVESEMMSFENQVLFVFEKLRRGISYKYMAVSWGCSEKFLQRTFNRLIPVLHGLVMGYQKRCGIPTVDEIQAMGVPKWFASFPDARFIVDCTDFPTQAPGNISLKRKLFSNYKNLYSAKVLLCMQPNGYLCEVSLPFPGRVSDDEIAATCEFVKICETGDMILSDKGFRFPERIDGLKSNVQVVAPNFGRRNEQIDVPELRRSSEIAKARSHVERVVRSIKLFQIFRCIHLSHLPRLHQMTQLAGFLVNLQHPIFADLAPLEDDDDDAVL